MMASLPPRSSITEASRMYITPIRLWSTLVIHSCQRYGRCPFTTTQASTARIPTSTTAPAISGIGWSNGIADQSSLPSIMAPTVRPACFGCELRPRSRRNMLGRDQVEQSGIIEPVARPALLDALLHQLLIAVLIEDGIALRRGRHPIRKGERRDHVDVEHHVRKAVAREMRRQALQLALVVGAQVQLRHHSVHGVDHAAEP